MVRECVRGARDSGIALGERGIRGERLIRLNRQFRLILRLETDEQGKLVCFINIEDYH